MTTSYAAVLRTPHASRTFAFAFLGRLSYGTVFLSLTLALTASTGSYAQAGGLLALLGLTVSVVSPVRAALIDRYGPRRALVPMTAAYALVLLVLPKRQRSSPPGRVTAHDRHMRDRSTDDPTHQEYWDSRYSEHHHMWSGEPNSVLVQEAAELEPGTALDLGCGEGADAVWLARRGWRVTAVDISGVALERAAGHAAEAGVADRIDWQRRDLAASFPEGSYDLVSAQFLHSPAEMPREEVLRAAAGAVAPGGVLLVVGHAGPPPWDPDAHPSVHLPTPDEVFESLALSDGDWEVLRSDEHERVQTAPDGRTMTRTDNALKLRRRAR